ncbi:glycosyltransferase family 2 protein [Aureisphaera sp. CAU 1614]|uniref:Glycosyltransferase family 2 protein n=1 Tax=Halomarinibacterium sedimenti TaxID=2857106 RepID=A0A9X1FNE6_9FLAO|nr:glycosyltransferase family A protein [Halomarinibacterium sedimenti]MBW2937721.1 glycosyltransferase family 2 protein [Halomarinibacterium sedimenti]
MQKPIVSVIVPCYNQAEYLPGALHSVLNQSFEEWECIIVNDGSEDSTETVAQEWTQKDGRFKYIVLTNGGLPHARNSGIKEAIGTYILPLDADDKLAPNYMKLAMDEFKEDSKLKVVYCNAEKFGVEHGPWKLKDFSIKKLAISNMIFCTAFFTKKDWEAIGGYDVAMKYGWEDWEFWIALLKHGGGVKKLSYVGFFYRIKEKSMLQDLKETQKEELFNYMSIKHPDFYVRHVGSFQKLLKKQEELNKKNRLLLSNKKHALNVLCYSVFRWRPFKIRY